MRVQLSGLVSSAVGSGAGAVAVSAEVPGPLGCGVEPAFGVSDVLTSLFASKSGALQRNGQGSVTQVTSCDSAHRTLHFIKYQLTYLASGLDTRITSFRERSAQVLQRRQFSALNMLHNSFSRCIEVSGSQRVNDGVVLFAGLSHALR